MNMKQKLRDAFIPHTQNDYTPDMLQRSAVLGMLFLVLLSFTAANFHALLWQTSDWLVGAVLPAVVVNLTNTERDDAVLPALVRNPVLDEAARLKAEHMATKGYFAHYSPDGISPWHWFGVAGYRFVHAGENLAVHFSDSDAVVDAWMDSPTHRANIVNGNYREIGVGTAKGTFEGYPTVFVVQLFGTPAVPATNTAELVLPGIAVTPEVAMTAATRTEPVATVAGAETESIAAEVVEAVPEAPSVVISPDTIPVVALAEPTTAAGVPVVDAFEHMATSTGLPEATISMSTAAESTPTGIVTASVRPSLLLQGIYSVIGLLVAIALALSVCMEWRRQRPLQVAYGIALLLGMSGLFYLHVLVSSGVTIV